MRTLAGLLFAVLLLTACGKKGPLVYPDMLVPAAPSNLSAQQSGNSIKLSFVIPSKNLAGQTIAGLSDITILKRDDPTGQSPGCSSCLSDFSLFRKLNLDLLPTGVQRYGNLLVLLDGDVQSGRTYIYRVSAVTRDYQEGALSAPVSADMVATPLPPSLQVISQPTEIHLEFSGLPPGEGIIIGYNVYRTLKGNDFPLLPLNREPLPGNRFVDVGLERGTSYIYGVRTVLRLPSGSKVESGLSNQAEGRLMDDE
jgi:predicted small lipoprotein YifL